MAIDRGRGRVSLVIGRVMGLERVAAAGHVALELAADLAHRGLDILRGAGHAVLHLLELVELHRAVDLGLDVGDIALRLAEQGADHARDARQLLGADDDKRHRTDQRELGYAEIDHSGSVRTGPQPLVLASTSMADLSAAACCVTWGAAWEAGWAAALSSAAWLPPSFMPSLKPLTAPPRSEPRFLSFLVPNTMTTISRTISQCQMEKLPIL